MSTNYKTIIKEEVNLSGYSDEDFIEVFVEYFRPWIKENHGDEISKYPMSLLVKKYISEFAEHYQISLPFGGTLKKMTQIGLGLAEKGIKELPSLNKGYFFTEKFKKIIDDFFLQYNFPNFVKLHFEEDSPFNVDGYLEIEFEPLIKYKGSFSSMYSFDQEFINFVKSYMGFEIGSTSHGKLNLQMMKPRLVGSEEWYKNFFSKQFKKTIKEVPKVQSYLHSVKLEINSGRSLKSDIFLTFKRNTDYIIQSEIISIVQDYLESLGYNRNYLRVRRK